MITLRGNPKSTQHCYKHTGRRTYMSKSCVDLKEFYKWEAASQWKKEPLKEFLTLEVKLFFGDRRIRDIDNFNKLWMDALTGIVYGDDNQIKKLTVERAYDKENPRIEINTIEN